MASPRSVLRIVGAEPLGPATRTLDVIRVDGAPWANVRGKYVILDTGLVLPDGKAVKRAYSLTPLEGEAATRCRLIVKRLDDGPGSNALHAAPIGAEFTFSGPWGKLVTPEESVGSTLFVATDTGITAALGVASRAHLGRLAVLWLRTSDESFFDVERARAAIAQAGAHFVTATIPAIGAAGRAEAAWRHVDGCVAEHAPNVLLAAGDGEIVFPLKARSFPVASVQDVRIECFFHNPERKSA